ncbi:MAG: U32 family peptidase [Candidatus Omnitrophica bacterium]|nr:U32 family peptidase [Candidatus Omnitrophota bacterium]
MRLTVPTNWQDDLIKKIKKPGVDTVYGKLDRDFVGGGRPSCILNKVTKNKAKLHVGDIHKEGLKFYYLLNSSCLGNLEWTSAGHRELSKLLAWLLDIGTDGVAVANPYIAQHIRAKYPHLEISVSCFANVNSVEKAKFWEDMGVSTITLPPVELNRDFKLLRKVRENIKCQLQLIVNDNCLSHCPLFIYHNNLTSHASQSKGKVGIFMFDYCFLICKYLRIKEPANFIRAAWIRPEDISVYENIGIDRFKVVDRGMHADAIALIADAYSKRSYKGNLYDLFNNPSTSLWLNKPSFFHKFRYFFHPFTVNLFKLFKNRKVVQNIKVSIDNTKLDGFIEYFFDHECRYNSCAECGYCTKIAQKALKIDPDFREKALEDYGSFIKEIISGGIFKY